MNILCTKDFFMDDGERCFTAGETYNFKFEVDAWVTKDDQGDTHWMGEDDIAELKK